MQAGIWIITKWKILELLKRKIQSKNIVSLVMIATGKDLTEF